LKVVPVPLGKKLVSQLHFVWSANSVVRAPSTDEHGVHVSRSEFAKVPVVHGRHLEASVLTPVV